MEILNDVLNKARDVLDTAYKKTEKAVNVSKQKMDISSMRQAIARRYEKLGREVIKEFDDVTDLPDNIAAIVSDIREREQILRLAEEELGESSGKAACRSCGAKNRAGAKFCNSCGAPLN